MVHGQKPAQQKDETCNVLKQETLKYMVSTTVIEVGIDVPNASVMVIESAEKFGFRNYTS